MCIFCVRREKRLGKLKTVCKMRHAWSTMADLL